MKPLFYFKEQENIIIASEIKSIKEILGTHKLTKQNGHIRIP